MPIERGFPLLSPYIRRGGAARRRLEARGASPMITLRRSVYAIRSGITPMIGYVGKIFIVRSGISPMIGCVGKILYREAEFLR